MDLADKWSNREENVFYYIDGHIQVYSGYMANLGKKHVSRQHLCLPGVDEYWINNKEGLPYFYVPGEVNEKLLEMLVEHIIPKLLSEIQPKYTEQQLLADPDLPLFTVVFDREGYSPVLFDKLWKDFRVAVLTYRKNVKDKWAGSDFTPYMIVSESQRDTMNLAEKETELNKVKFREVRKLSDDGHQTSIITTNRKITTQEIALNMFSRWSQENYFKYMRKEYDFDRMLQYTVDTLDNDLLVVNPVYSNLSYSIKKTREKISRRKAILLDLEDKNISSSLENTSKHLKKQTIIREEIESLNKIEQELINQRSKEKCKITIKEMPEKMRYNKLNYESKHFQNIIKMICYRAETSCANVLSEFYKRSSEEKRELVKSIIFSHGNLLYDENAQTLTVKIYSLSNPRMNHALEKLCEFLNQLNYNYPNTNIKLFYKTAN